MEKCAIRAPAIPTTSEPIVTKIFGVCDGVGTANAVRKIVLIIFD